MEAFTREQTMENRNFVLLERCNDLQTEIISLYKNRPRAPKGKM